MLLLAISLCYFASCEKDEDQILPAPPAGTSMTEIYFGTYYGMCIGECANIYWLRGEELLRDTISNFYASGLILGDVEAFDQLTEDEFEVANGLIEAFPQELVDQPATIGMPDAYDQGGFFIAIADDEAENGYREWAIDTDLDNVPENLHPFLNEIMERVELLMD